MMTESQAPITIEVRHPIINASLGVVLYADIANTSHRVYLEQRRRNFMLGRAADAGTTASPRELLSIEERSEHEAQMVAGMIVGWDTAGAGSEVPFTPEGVLNLMRHQPWVRAQVLHKLEGVDHFFRQQASQLIAWAEHYFLMERVDKDGVKMRDTLNSVWKQWGGTPEAKPIELIPPCDFPALLHHVWIWFAQLSQTRGYTKFGPSPITWAEISAWRQEMREEPTKQELDLILALDGAFLRAGALHG